MDDAEAMRPANGWSATSIGANAPTIAAPADEPLVSHPMGLLSSGAIALLRPGSRQAAWSMGLGQAAQ